MALFVLSLCPFDISVGVGAFVIGLSQISSFFSLVSCDHPCERLFVSTHADITIHSYKNGLSEVCKNVQSIFVRMDRYFRVGGDLRVIENHVEHAIDI